MAAGAGAAIGGTFNAPIAGVLFAMEVILGGFASRSFGLVVVSSVAATAVVQSALGTEPAFELVERFTLVSNWEFGLYLGLGVITGIVALAYVWMVYQVEETVRTVVHPRLGQGAPGRPGSGSHGGVREFTHLRRRT